jgi:hypothetical protein
MHLKSYFGRIPTDLWIVHVLPEKIAHKRHHPRREPEHETSGDVKAVVAAPPERLQSKGTLASPVEDTRALRPRIAELEAKLKATAKAQQV